MSFLKSAHFGHTKYSRTARRARIVLYAARVLHHEQTRSHMFSHTQHSTTRHDTHKRTTRHILAASRQRHAFQNAAKPTTQKPCRANIHIFRTSYTFKRHDPHQNS